MTERTCDVEGCEAKHYGKGLCLSHYARMASRRRRDPEAFAAFQAELAAKRARRAAQDVATEKPCSKCGIMQPTSEFSPATRASDGLHWWCKACVRALAKARYDPEVDARWQAKRRSDPGYKAKAKVSRARWYAENTAKALAAGRRWREDHPEQAREIKRAWIAADPEKYALLQRARHNRRRASKRGAVVSKADFAAILVRDGMVCHICGKDIPSLSVLHFDHVIPLSKGGPHSMENIRPACAHCNLVKSDKMPEAS